MKEMLLKQSVLLKLSTLVSTSMQGSLYWSIIHCCIIGGGNSFRLLKCLQEENLLPEIRKKVLQVSDPCMSAIHDQYFHNLSGSPIVSHNCIV
jgi:hypothetical protein